MAAPNVDEVLVPDEVDPKLEAGEMPKPSIRVEWDEQERADVERIKSMVESEVRSRYAQAFAIEESLLQRVRVRNPPSVRATTGETWARNPDGSYMESWGDVTISDMEAFIQSASSWSFFLSQYAIDDYAEAVFAKYAYDDAYDDAYARQSTGTIGDKQAVAKKRTRDERWLALYKTIYYRRAKEVVDRLDQHVRRVERIYVERQREREREFRAGGVPR